MFELYLGSCAFYCITLAISFFRCYMIVFKYNIEMKESSTLESIYSIIKLFVIMILPIINVVSGLLLLFLGIFMDEEDLIYKLKMHNETNGL